MRPPVPDVAAPRSCKSSFEQQQWTDPRSAVPATFFLARNHDQHSDELFPEESDVSRDSMYGVQSIDETARPVSLESSQCEPDLSASNRLPSQPAIPDQHHPHNNLNGDDNENDEGPRLGFRRSTLKPLDHIRADTSLQPPSDPASSRPLTPLNADYPLSLPSSPKSISIQSMKHLDDISIADDLSSQAVGSGEEDNDAREAPNLGHDSISQLIMPSIKMPSRRPFTDRGKAMGRLKVLLAGASGSGKTSLIKSIVQACEDIVHVDPFPSPTASKRSLSFRSHARTMPVSVSEIYASTKPYPTWWSDLEDSRVLRRRKSTGDIVLERNLCFVDTPASSLSRAGQTDTIVQYIQQQFLRATTALNSSNIDFQNLLAGNGGAQVDAVLYLISEDTLATDIQCIQKLCDLTNVIPVIAKSDLLSPDRIDALKSSFHEQAQAVGIKSFLFGDASLGETYGFGAQSPFAVSSAKSSDDEVMDASILMSPDYVQPLVPSELTILVQKLFDHDNIAWIRHSAAKKLVQRQHEQPYQRQIATQNSTVFSGAGSMTSSVPSGSSVDGFISLPSGRSPSYTMARISDYTRHEEKMARVQLAKWAADLQQSLQNERERYAAMANGERAVWLTERLGECVVDGSLVPVTQTAGSNGLHIPTEKGGTGLLVRTRNGQKSEYYITHISPLDPLGLIWWSDDLKRRGWAIVQVVGSFGVLGGLAVWLAKTWGLPSSKSLSEWRFEWCGTSE